MRHEPRHDELLRWFANLVFQIGPGKGIRARLFDNCLSRQRGKLVNDRAAFFCAVEKTTRRTLVGDMDDPAAGSARRIEQQFRASGGLPGIDQCKWPREVGILVID